MKFWTYSSNCSSFVSSALPSFWSTYVGKNKNRSILVSQNKNAVTFNTFVLSVRLKLHFILLKCYTHHSLQSSPGKPLSKIKNGDYRQSKIFCAWAEIYFARAGVYIIYFIYFKVWSFLEESVCCFCFFPFPLLLLFCSK